MQYIGIVSSMTDKQITAMTQEAPNSAVVVAMIDHGFVRTVAVRRAGL